MSIIIGGVSIPLVAGFDIAQTLDALSGRVLLRAKNGNGIIQSRWQKLATRISGAGFMPDGLDGLDLSVPVSIACGVSLSKASGSNIITIPRAFRTDGEYAPAGVAIMGHDGQATPLTMDGSEATLTVVAGATAYHVVYFPILSCAIKSINRSLSDANAQWAWSIDAEEL